MDYRSTFESNAYTKSNYLKAEEDIQNILRHFLITLGYKQAHPNNYIYSRDNKKVYLAFVDDIEQLNVEFHQDFLESFTEDDIIITDNFIHRPTLAKIFQVPYSWFGIYYYEPDIIAESPDRFFSYKARRLDTRRLALFLEMAFRINSFDQGYVSLDCWDHSTGNDDQKRQLAERYFGYFDPETQDKYSHVFAKYKNKLPYTNHTEEIDEVMQRSLYNVVVETYSSDYTVAFSEKIFRALVTPRLWTLYSGRFSCKILDKLGFDTLKDLVDHKQYDNHTHKDHKITDFVVHANPLLLDTKWEDVKTRCHQAAEHNKNLLYKWKLQWPKDFAEWLPAVIDELKN